MGELSGILLETRLGVEFHENEVINTHRRREGDGGTITEPKEHWRHEQDLGTRGVQQAKLSLERCVQGDRLGGLRLVKEISLPSMAWRVGKRS